MELTRTSVKLKRTILCNVRRDEKPYPAPIDSGYFSLILIKSGVGYLTVTNRTGETATFSVRSPLAVCLRDGENLSYSITDGDIYSLVFSPTFINVNMRPSVMERETYEMLADTYHLFRLASFMENHMELKTISMNHEQMDTYFRLCKAAETIMEEKDPDKCWSCRIRANVMDILTGLETQYTYGIRATSDTSLTFMTYRDIVVRIHGDLAHPCRIEDICRDFGINKNKLQVIFRRYGGCSYYDFIKKARLERARRYLAFTELKLSEIAYRVGFSTEQHFYRFFKRELGGSPQTFRRTAVANRKADLTISNTKNREDPGCYPSKA